MTLTPARVVGHGVLVARTGCQCCVGALNEKRDYLPGRNREWDGERVTSSTDHGRLRGGLRKDGYRRETKKDEAAHVVNSD